jgi:NADH:ubiquinone oxidoreductase subunit H
MVHSAFLVLLECRVFHYINIHNGPHKFGSFRTFQPLTDAIKLVIGSNIFLFYPTVYLTTFLLRLLLSLLV